MRIVLHIVGVVSCKTMALRELVEGDCGAANPLVQWSSHFHQHKPLAQGGVHHDRLQEVGHNLYPNKLFSASTNLLNFQPSLHSTAGTLDKLKMRYFIRTAGFAVVNFKSGHCTVLFFSSLF